ncbi:MAG: DUF4406 domain-containing protein [Patescibacteria group bacterium]|nr:DUF4406 domain-containing protein [Patescibacteria group bacterium]
MSGKRFYLCGPMSGIPQFNIPMFDRIAARCRAFYEDEIVSPAELDDPETRKAALASPDGAPGSGSANGQTWGDFLARDVKLVADTIDGIIVLPGWERSRGARLEVFVGLLCKKEFFEWNDNVGIAYPRTAQYIRNELKDNMP